ncbi:MAG: glycosyltransferase, partial [Thermoplasmatales archaeon]
MTLSDYDISVISTPYFPQPSEFMGAVEKVSFQRFQELGKFGYRVNFIAPISSRNDQVNLQSIRLARPSKVPDNRNIIRWMFSTRSFDYFMPYLNIPKDKIGKIVFLDGWRLEPWDFFSLNHKLRHSYIINILHPPVIFIDRFAIRSLSFLYKSSNWGALNLRIHEYFLQKGYTSYYLPNGINIPDKNRIIRNSDEFLIFFGRIEPSKAPHLAIKLARNLGIPLKIYGRIHDYEYFVSKIKPYLDTQNIMFYGEVSYVELFESLRNAKGTVYFSDAYDPLPTVLLESISYGVPVIGYGAHPLSGFHDVIKGKVNGVLVKSADITSSFSKRRLLDDLDLINRLSVYDWAQKNWSWNNIIKTYYVPFLDK